MKHPANGPPLDTGLAEAISVKNQWPPLAESYRHWGSPPLLQCLAVRPMSLFSGMIVYRRCRVVLKIRISPRLFASTTDPLPAHRPWSGGSMSPIVGACEALSTALMPFTPTAPPADVLMESQARLAGWQLTVGIWMAELCPPAGTWGRSKGSALPRSCHFADPAPVWRALNGA